MNVLSIIAIAATVTITGLIVLALTDPKRRRMRYTANPAVAVARYLATAVALLPGLWLLVTLQAASLFIWLGVAALGGWFLTMVLPRISTKD